MLALIGLLPSRRKASLIVQAQRTALLESRRGRTVALRRDVRSTHIIDRRP